MYKQIGATFHEDQCVCVIISRSLLLRIRTVSDIIIIIIIIIIIMCEREKLPKLKTNSKFIKLQEEVNGVIEELL